MLNVYRTASHLSGPEQAFFREYRLSPASYNLLRILRGNHRGGDVQGVRASEIGCQMVVRMPDVTRLVDRLESMKLVTRRAASDDKRVKYVQITKKGLALLDEIDPKLDGLIEKQLGHMNEQDLRALSRLLELARYEEHQNTQTTSTRENSA